MIDTQAIRSKILDLAMRGKLTEQLPEDGTAEELYRQIQAEKQALIKAGKIKKEKPLPEIAVDEVPFEIPTNWKWVVFGKVITLQSGQDLKPEEYNACENGLPYLTGASNYNENGQLIINRWTEQPKNLAIKGDILLSCKGTVGKLAILAVDRVHIARQFMAIRTYNVNVRFVALFMQSVIEGIKKASKGLIPGIERNDILRLSLPLPPLAEQHRIVARIEQAFSALDTIDALQAKYADNLAVLKSKLIDAAIQGKLTEQLPEDGTADELYRQIQAGKQALIKSGKIKKEKPLPEISADEIPFELPANWKWVRFSDLYSISNGVASRGTPEGKPHPVLRLADLVSGKIDTHSIREIALSDEEFSTHKVRNGDLVFIRVNGSRDKVANAFLYSGETVISYCDHLFCGHRTSNSFDASYIMTVYHSAMAKAQIDPEIKTTAGQNTISQKRMGKVLIPLPPLAEQTRIVAKLEELLSLCERVG